MKLFYRGVSYEYDVATGAPLRAAAPVRQPFNLSYRGLSYKVDPDKASRSEAIPSAAILVYRGLSYALNGGKIAMAAAVKPVDFKLFTTKAAEMVEVSNMHRANIYRQLERRLKTAESNNDQTLVQLLQQELKQVA